MLKVCFWGLGSIGQRHFKNLCKIADQANIQLEIHAFRTRNKRVGLERIDKEIYKINQLDNDYDIAFITNPTFKHYSTIKTMLKKTKNMFIEKPIFDTIDIDLRDINFGKGVYYIAAPLRYTSVFKKLKDVILKYQIYSVRAICSSYLPDWREERDYRKLYSAKKELGGGVSIDLIHEWDYLAALFGFPQKIYNLQGKFSHLEINSDDLAIYIAEYEDKLIELHLDYFGRKPRREIELYTKDGIILGDFINKKVILPNGAVFKSDNQDMYIEEMNNFINMLMSKSENINPPEYAYKVLKLVKESSR